MRKYCLNFFFILLIAAIMDPLAGFGQENDNETGKPSKNEKVPQPKKGWTFGVLPAISFNTDVGFQYGALSNIYYYGDGSTYPEYLHSIYLEWSTTTRGSGIARFYYDSEYLIPRVRLTADISYLTEKAMQFYGFNGYDAVYNASWEDETSPDYRSRVYYRHDRKIFRVMANFQGNLLQSTDKFKWITGFAYYGVDTGPVDIDRLNKGQDEEKKLPDIPGLYDRYVEWGVITPEERDGNDITYLKGGLIYDSRDVEANPFKGMWSEAVISYAPGFLGDGAFSYAKLTLMHRQYFTLKKDVLSFAYRLGFQGTLSGRVPFHIQPHIVPTFLTSSTSQGLGGSRTLRGVLRNRVVGDDIYLANVELRWKFLRTVVFNQNLYLGTNIFFDAGGVAGKMEADRSGVPVNVDQSDFFAIGAEKLHMTAGIGLKIALNENFIVSCDTGKAFDPRDGNLGVYTALNYLF